MKSIKIPLILVVAGLLVAGLQGCAVGGFRAANSGVTTLPNFLSGNLVPVSEFSMSDVICFFVNVTWDDVTKEAGSKDIAWNWYKDGRLVGHREKLWSYFKNAPETRVVRQPAMALGTGHFKVECVVDGTTIATREFDIR